MRTLHPHPHPERARSPLRRSLPAALPPYNLAPSQEAPIITDDGVQLMKWGFAPSWAKRQMINARSETAAEKPMFRAAFKARRCLIPADGYFEWHRKHPYYFTRKDHKPFAFAGIYENGSFAILTASADDLVRQYHERMPLIPKNEQRYLTQADLTPLPHTHMHALAVSTRVNSPAHDDRSCIFPIQK